MDFKVILSRPALRDLGDIARFIGRDNASVAERVGLELVGLAESLGVMPHRGANVRERPGLRQLIHGPYLVIYRPDESRRVVNVLRFWHAKRDPRAFGIY